MDNMSLKEIQGKLLLWESSEHPLAPLTSDQREAILDLESLILGVTNDLDDDKSKVTPKEEPDKSMMPPVDSTYDFLEWYESLYDSTVKTADAPYEAYHKQLEDRRNECVALTNQIDATISDLTKLSEQYNFVSNKTNALHTMSEQLLADQNKLSAIGEDIKSRLHYFTQVEHLSQRLASPTLSVNSDAFFTLLAKIDECLDYMRANSEYKESHTYLVKYRHLQSRAISLMRSYAEHVLEQAGESVLQGGAADAGADTAASRADTAASRADTAASRADTAYAVYFGRFQAAARRLARLVAEAERRAARSDDYASLLHELQRSYAARRARAAGGAARAALLGGGGGEREREHEREPCARARAACSLLAHACRDECALYEQIFSRPAPGDTDAPLQQYLQSLCGALYEALRPQIIHINHLETLAELCVILRVEVLEEQVDRDPAALAALGAAARALLQDAQERLVFRAHVHLRHDVLRYRPAPGDLAYPDKLLMMEEIAMSIQQEQAQKSRLSPAEGGRPSASPADLHGMWYPGVRRTLAALSRLYRCLEKKVFQGLAQEAISFCVQNVEEAAKQISINATPIDGELFQIKHLLILREQIAPFQVDFVIKETSLDFSNMKNAAYGLIQKPRQIFSLNSNNALLEFLVEGAPQVREQLLDSRKLADRALKRSCERLIAAASHALAGPLAAFLARALSSPPAAALRAQAWAAAPALAALVRDTRRRVRDQLAPLQRSLQLYLANKETEFILFRPIRNNVVGYFVQLEQLLRAHYSAEDALLVAAPAPDQLAVFLSAAGLGLAGRRAPPYGAALPADQGTQHEEEKGPERVEKGQEAEENMLEADGEGQVEEKREGEEKGQDEMEKGREAVGLTV